MAAAHTVNTRSYRVGELIVYPFIGRTDADKFRIVLEGKPRPSIKMLSVKKETGGITEDFNATSMYDEIPWLTGCPTKNKLYCWPCLLFAEEPGLWNRTGIADMVVLMEGKSLHETTIAHMDAVVKLQLFNDKLKSSMNNLLEVKEKCARSGEIKKRLIEVCCVAIGQQSPNKCSNDNVLDVEKCLKVMKFLRNYDRLNKNVSNDAINVIETSPQVINSVVNAFTKVVNMAIIKEINSSKYVSLILSGHSDGKYKSQISTVLRYMKNGQVCERFVGFTNMNSKQSEPVYQHILNVMKEYAILEKLNAVSLDGNIFKTDAMVTFLEKMKASHPACCFVPWHSHDVVYTFQQCFSSFPTCGQFFTTMTSMQTYFQRNSAVFLDLLSQCDLSVMLVYFNTNSECTGNGFASPHFISTVKKQRKSFIHFFYMVVYHCQKWDADDLAKAFGFRKYLQKLKTIFLLEVFSRIFEIISPLTAALRSDNYDFEKDIGLQVTRDLTTMRARSFNVLWGTMKKEIERTSFEKEYNSNINLYLSLFNSIVELTMYDISTRFTPWHKLKFCNMFDFDSLEGSKRIASWLKSLKETQGWKLNETLICNELLALWKCRAFPIKSASDFYRFICQSNINNAFKALTDVAELITTMPFKPASVSGDISKLQIIEKWAGDVINTPTYGDVRLLYIESEFFEDIKKLPSFHDETMDFIQLT